MDVYGGLSSAALASESTQSPFWGHSRRFWDVRGLPDAPQDQRTGSVTARGTNSDVTSALRLMAMPANTPATAST
jgi:hypothetical protein